MLVMIRIRKILFPYDLSAAATAVAPAVSEMARRFQASVTVLYAFNQIHDYNLAPIFDGSKWENPGAIPYTPALRALRKEDARCVEEFARAQLPNVEWVTLVQDGDPASVIEWAANREQADLIMMSTRSAGRLRRILPGSVATKIIQSVSCPVFTSAHAPWSGHETRSGYHSIMTALRLDAESEKTLKMAAFLGQAYGARLCLLHVTPPDEPPETAKPVANLRQFFEQALGAEDAASLETRFRTLNGSVLEGIRKTALEEAADLVVVGRGRSQTSFSPSWTHLYTVIRQSPCPVLTV
ncbi:MAG: universal stress protein [Terracidiphilus sp.]